MLHDHCLGRTVPGAGPVSRRTLGELRSLDAGSWFGEEFAGALIPTLGEVLELGRGRARFEVELRGIGSGFLDGVLETIDDLGVTEEVELTSSHPPLLLRARAEQPLLRTGVLVGPYPDWRHPGLGTGALIAWLTLLDAQAAHLCPELQVPEVVEPLRRAGFAIHAAEVNDEPGLDAALGLEVQQLSTGCLDLALEKVGPRQERRRAPRARAV